MLGGMGKYLIAGDIKHHFSTVRTSAVRESLLRISNLSFKIRGHYLLDFLKMQEILLYVCLKKLPLCFQF